ncbi:outer membrane protein assembly factor BamD [Candidatus Pantoea edessiphila]|uniref:Outer membrane protein assembly factor BamD n=1 Tax=Candidatus Pantoea edessiphila TaxID=2044610 RepID=A0A2P5SXQ0_9GAMM|nr:outer membrane protein assembly factor BamD [Candidatus Pantoea edessiphila]MBK4775662.1 outer membrane protein assembly factor BamD [Pantoea sp. Edef]PPI87105.1 outer membrane protein assembly factor BamD [Candidatus Pantoea edessiphila]
MKLMKYISTILILILIITGCSEFNVKELTHESLPILNDIAQKNIQKGNFKTAIKYLEIIKNIDLIGSYTKQAQLDLIYVYYKKKDFNEARDLVNNFINLYPKHPNIDYVIYMKGLIEMSLDNPVIMKVLYYNRFSHDPEHAYNAFNYFLQLLKKYPKSEYVHDAYLRLIYLKNRLANYELSIASFYDKKEAYVAVITRINNMLIYYPDTKATLNALPLMEKAYRKLQINNEADKISKIISLNH